MPKKIYYKVCRVDTSNGGKQVSFKKDYNLAPLEYEIGKTTKPRQGDGPCCVFDCLDAATAFLNKYADIRSGYCIMECTIVKSKSCRVWQKQNRWWIDGAVWKSNDMRKVIPHTVLATQVTPHRIVYRDNSWGRKDK